MIMNLEEQSSGASILHLRGKSFEFQVRITTEVFICMMFCLPIDNNESNRCNLKESVVCLGGPLIDQALSEYMRGQSCNRTVCSPDQFHQNIYFSSGRSFLNCLEVFRNSLNTKWLIVILYLEPECVSACPKFELKMRCL